MKKFILGCTLMICGIMGGTGWLLSYVMISGANRWPSLLESFPLIGLDVCKDSFVVVAFYFIALIGFVFSVANLEE